MTKRNTYQIFMRLLFASLMAVGLVLVAMGEAQAQSSARFRGTDEVKGIVLGNLDHLRGQFVTIYYATAVKPFVGFNDRQLKVLEIKHAVTSAIDRSALAFEPVTIPATGIRSYNFVVIVVHPAARFSWVNGDGHRPQDPRGAGFMVGPSNPSLVISISRPQMEQLAAEVGESSDYINVKL